MKKLILIFLLAAVVNCYAGGDTPLQNAKITDTSQIASGTFNVKTGVVVTYESGSTLDATAATLKVGTITGATNANVKVDANGTGKFEVDDAITAGTNQDVKIAPNGTGKLDLTATALKAGTATAGTAPLKFTSGTNLTSPEAGATEFDGNFFYGTNSGAVRQRFSTDASAFAIPSSDIDWSKSASFTKTLGANTTFTFSNATDGRSIVVAVTNTASNYTVTWPAVSWSGGTAPVQSTGANTDVYCFVKIGSTIYGSAVQANNSLTASQMPPFTGDMQTSAGSTATTVTKINGVDQTTAWTAYTPAITAGGGSITTVGAVSGRYKQIGKSVLLELNIVITTAGTATGDLEATLPVTAISGVKGIFHGREDAISGKMLQGYFLTTVKIGIRDYSNVTVFANGVNVIMSGVYEAN